MLYLVGGASRAGKSMLARRLLERRGIPYFSIDVLMMGLARGLPEFGLDPDHTAEERGEKLWPILRAMAVNLLEEESVHPAYLMEGDELLPGHVAELVQDYPGRVRACFIGYAHAIAPAKLRQVRAREANWLTDYPDVEVLAFIEDMIRFSRSLQRECAALGLAYFDCSDDLGATVEEAYGHLVEGQWA